MLTSPLSLRRQTLSFQERDTLKGTILWKR
jgi:hypothetical protein